MLCWHDTQAPTSHAARLRAWHGQRRSLPAILPSPEARLGHKVEGLLLQDLTAVSFVVLDFQEDDGYDRLEVTVLVNDELRPAMVYLWPAARRSEMTSTGPGLFRHFATRSWTPSSEMLWCPRCRVWRMRGAAAAGAHAEVIERWRGFGGCHGSGIRIRAPAEPLSRGAGSVACALRLWFGQVRR